MADKRNLGEKTAAEADYDKKFNRQLAANSDSKDLKAKEAAGDTGWKTTAVKKNVAKPAPKSGRFAFIGRHGGKLRHGSAFVFIVAMLGLGVWYTSVFAPNILLVNIKEMYTNDLADSTIALDTYYKKMMNYKIGRPNCGEKDSIKCKLSTMSRAQKKAFEKHGFTVLGSKVEEDNRDDGNPQNDKPESRYQVLAIIPPTQSPGFIATGDMLWLYSQLSSANKSLVYSVFNPKSSFYMDTRYKQRIKSKYNMTKSVTTGGNTEQAVNRSFDSSVQNGGSIGLFGQPDSSNGISLSALSNPVSIAQYEIAMIPLAAQTYSYVGLQCAWYSFAKQVTNNAKSAKAATVARFAMQYLKAADAVKAGISEEIPTNVLSSKLASDMSGSYGGQNATDSSMYRAIVYNNLPIPSIFGLLYYLDTFDLIAAFAPAWSQIMASAAAEGVASNVPGLLAMPPANLLGTDRDYCLGGETLDNHQTIKNNTEEDCVPQVTASAPPGWQGALSGAIATARETCPIPHYDDAYRRIIGTDLMQPSLKESAVILSPYVAGIFGANSLVWANIMSLLFTSSTRGVPASDAIFAGTGEILGDMAQSRGMMPSNAVNMVEYLAQKDEVQKEHDEVARYNGRKDPFDIYNKFSFLGSIAHSLSPTYSDKAPLLAALTNSISLLGSSIKRLNPSADAIYYLQPAPFNPLRLSCPDPEYLFIGIMADTACNVRYSFSRLELAAQPDMVLDYMTKEHSQIYQEKIDELTQRLAKADPEAGGDAANITRMIATYELVRDQPFIDKKTGKAIPNSEYDKFLQYCVNRQDPWGRSGLHIQYTDLSPEERQKRLANTTNSLEGVSSSYKDPYERIPYIAYPSIVEGTKSDQDWYSGKKCGALGLLDPGALEMLTNFRAYTMMCSVDGSFSGGVDCTDNDNANIAAYSDNFYTSNDILYTGW